MKKYIKMVLIVVFCGLMIVSGFAVYNKIYSKIDILNEMSNEENRKNIETNELQEENKIIMNQYQKNTEKIRQNNVRVAELQTKREEMIYGNTDKEVVDPNCDSPFGCYFSSNE